MHAMMSPQPPAHLPCDAAAAERTLVMGILNVTPDSFSDGGEHYTANDAFTHAQRMIAQGADIIDVGGESTRPGAVRISVEEELRRILPVIEGLAETGITISVDTMNAATARAAVAAGAHIINDVSGMRAAPQPHWMRSPPTRAAPSPRCWTSSPPCVIAWLPLVFMPRTLFLTPGWDLRRVACRIGNCSPPLGSCTRWGTEY